MASRAKYLDDDQRVLRAIQGRAQNVGHAGVQFQEGVALGASGDLQNKVRKKKKDRE